MNEFKDKRNLNIMYSFLNTQNTNYELFNIINNMLNEDIPTEEKINNIKELIEENIQIIIIRDNLELPDINLVVQPTLDRFIEPAIQDYNDNDNIIDGIKFYLNKNKDNYCNYLLYKIYLLFSL